MCCIFGIGFFAGHKLDGRSAVIGMVSNLLKEAECGGLRASGVAIMHRRGLGVLRRPVSGGNLSKLPEYDTFMDKHMLIGNHATADDYVTAIIGHARTPTKGSEYNNVNNHPVVVDHIVGVHNGTVFDNAIFNNFTKLKRIGEVDTEAIFQLVRYFADKWENKTIRAIQKASQYIQGGYACGLLNAQHPYNLFAFRNVPPIRILYYPKAGVVFFATREFVITRAIEPVANILGSPVEIDLLTDSGISFNLHNKSMCKFRLRSFRGEYDFV